MIDEPEIALPAGEVTGFVLARVFGRVRAEHNPRALPWAAPTKSSDKAEPVVTMANDDPAVKADILPTMRLLFTKAKAGEYDRGAEILSDASFGFGAWCSKFTALREEVHGLSAPEPQTRPRGPVYRRLD